MIPPFRKISSANAELMALQANLATVLEPLLKQGFSDFAKDLGELNTYAVAAAQAPPVYELGMSVAFKAASTNTGAATLNVNAMGRKAIVSADGAVLTGGEIKKGGIFVVRYDGTSFRLVNTAVLFLPLGGGTMLGQILGLQTDGNGLDVNPGSDIDADLLTVGVTSAPKSYWDESKDAFALTKGLAIDAAPSGTPAANTLYKHPNAGGQLVSALDASSVEAAIAGVLDAAQGGIAAGALEDWHEIGAANEPAFQNSWVNFGGVFATAAFRKLPNGRVALKGMVKSGTVGGVTPFFTLSSGYRPAETEYFAVTSADLFGELRIITGGAVALLVGSNTFASLSVEFTAGA